MRAFLFGSGWWTLWHVFVLSLLLPFAGLVWWLLIFDPKGGPQGGELAGGLLILFLLGWTLVSFIHAMMLAGTLDGGWARYAKAGLAWVVVWWAVGWGVYKLSDLAASVYASDGARRAGLVGLIVLVLLLYAANLLLLARVRRG